MWWPSTATVCYENDELPDWHPASGNYVDPDTGEVLPSWDQALDGVGSADQQLHVARFGAKFGIWPLSRDGHGPGFWLVLGGEQDALAEQG